MKEWILSSLECPECGSNIEIETDSIQDDEFSTSAYDGDKCKCADINCEFESSVFVTESEELGINQ